MHGFEGIDVGDRIQGQLISTDVERGFIDFKRVDLAETNQQTH
jgi:exoribonuclease-2